MTKKAWIIFATACIGLIVGLIFISNKNKVDVSNIDVSKVQVASTQNGDITDHTYGNMKSKVILFEYGDYQCPGCGDAYPVVKSVVEKYKDKMGFVFRNYPLTTIHPNALASATAVEAMGLQGKFWEAHDVLYKNQDSWNQLSGTERTDYFINVAKTLGLNSDNVADILNKKAEKEANQITKKIQYDIALGKKQNIKGTPALYINDKDINDKYFKDNKLVPEKSAGSQPVWSSEKAFEELVIIPALKEYKIIK